jgi:hypothetical protein
VGLISVIAAAKDSDPAIQGWLGIGRSPVPLSTGRWRRTGFSKVDHLRPKSERVHDCHPIWLVAAIPGKLDSFSRTGQFGRCFAEAKASLRFNDFWRD